MKSVENLKFIRIQVKKKSSKILHYIPELGFSHWVIILSAAIKYGNEVIDNCGNNGKMK